VVGPEVDPGSKAFVTEAQPTPDIAAVFIELGATVVGLALLARLASRWGFSAIPLYLIAAWHS